MDLILDTCTFIWLTNEPKRISKSVKNLIDKISTSLFLSDASIWEICIKYDKGKLVLPAPPKNWVEEQCSIWKLSLIPITRSTLYKITELPRHHADPFDRLIIATALETSIAVATPDPEISKYPIMVKW